ncbi:hypothetical protein [Paenibacillus sp. FJAT-26967]|uniref:hypothetical protein n=1 Tax=Paenibacillus sp. FJAT-26967 TaxID=1729690 RepID=UPI0008392F60|nr:hypothetical protein [Paenibacillus sp. FJAT-26967]
MKSYVRFISLMTVMFSLSACYSIRQEAVEKTVLTSNLDIASYEKNELVLDADVIAEGKVISKEVQKDFEGFPATDTKIKMTKVYKGSPEQEVEVRVRGGELGDVIYKFEEEDAIPTFREGERVFLFLTSNKGSRTDKNDFDYFVVGLYQGKFSEVDGKLKNKKFEFDLNTFPQELQALEEFNKTNKIRTNTLPEGQESKI